MTTVPGSWPVWRSANSRGAKKRPQAAEGVGTSAMSVPLVPADSSPAARKTRKPCSVVDVSSQEKTTPHSSLREGTTSAGDPS